MYPTLYTFDEPNPMPAALVSTYWINGARIGSVMTRRGEWPPPADLEKARPVLVEAHRRLLPIAKSRGDLIYLDGEALAENLLTLEACADVFCHGAPALRRAAFSPMPMNNREDYVAAASDPNHALHARYVLWKPFFDRMDFCDVPAYLLGQRSLETDLAFIAASRALAVQHYPNCRIIYSAWGNYHTNWNPPNVALPPDVLARYVELLTTHDDDVILFDPKPKRDGPLVSALLKGMAAHNEAQPPVRVPVPVHFAP